MEHKYIPLELLDYDEHINDIFKIECSKFIIVLIVFCLLPKEICVHEDNRYIFKKARNLK